MPARDPPAGFDCGEHQHAVGAPRTLPATTLAARLAEVVRLGSA
ncbi:hypothetical protein [Nonomuraea sp. NPDC003214]